MVGYPIYHSKASGVNAWISDLGNRLEINLPDGESANIWIQAPGGGHHQQQHQEHRGNRGYRERHQRGAAGNRKADPAPCDFYTVDYVQEMDNKKREAVAVKEMQAAATEGGEIKCMVLTAENNASVAMGSITDCIAAVNILVNMEEDVDDWMIAGINAMLDKVRVTQGIPFDLSTAICGVLGAQYR